MSEYQIVVTGNKKLMVNNIKFCEIIGAHKIFRVYNHNETSSRNYIWSIDHIPSGKMICWVYDWDQAEERGHALSQIYKDGADVSLDTVRAALGSHANNRSANLKGKEWQHDIVAPGSWRNQDV